MNKEFIPYEQALELKELGFDEECLAYYDEKLYFPYNDDIYGKFCTQPRDGAACIAPLYQQAFRWFREKQGLYGFTYSSTIINREEEKLYTNNIDEREGISYDTYEEAELACLKKLIEIIKNK